MNNFGYIFSGARERSWFANGHTEWYRDWSAVSGSCLATRRNVFEELSRFDEKIDVGADIEFCLRARRRNYRIVYTPYTRLLLHQSTDRSRQVGRLPYLLEYSQAFQTRDPYFNPNFSYQHTIPTVKTS